MASRKPQPSTAGAATKLKLSPEQIERAITRLQERITELENFDVHKLNADGLSPKLIALSTSILDTLERSFGEGTTAYYRFSSAADLIFSPGFASADYPLRHDYINGTEDNIQRSVYLLAEAQRALREDLADYGDAVMQESTDTSNTGPQALSRKVFIVHGHDDGAREMVARFLDRLGFQSIILHEQANRGGTVIEKIETHGDVGFAVVLLTPDDMGCANGGTPKPRVRQNVLLELGYFLGRLKRHNVCVLKRGTVEIPSDFAGAVWESMDDNGWKQALGRELEAAGHDIDWNKVMRA